jgi:hypothetical protein
VGAVVANWLLRKSPVDPLHFLPDQAQAVALIDLDALRTSQAFQLLQEAGDFDARDQRAFEQQWGLSPRDIKHIMIGWRLDAPNQRIVVVRTDGAINPADMVSKRRPRQYKESSSGGRPFFSGLEDAFYLAEDDFVVMGETATLARILERDRDAVLPPPLKDELERLKQHRGTVLIADAPALQQRELIVARVDFTQVLQSLAARAPLATLRTSWGPTVRATLTIPAPAPGQAEPLRELLDKDFKAVEANVGDLKDVAELLSLRSWKIDEVGLRAEFDLPPNLLLAPFLLECHPASYWVGFLKDSNDPRHRDAARELTTLGAKAVPRLGRALHSSSIQVRADSAAILGQIGPPAERAVSDLGGAMRDPEESVRTAAALALAKIGPAAKGARRSLIEALGDPSNDVRRAAATTLQGLDPPTLAEVPVLCDTLQSRHPKVWKHVLPHLGELGPQARQDNRLRDLLVGHLLQGLTQPDQVRQAAEEALRKIRPFAATDASSLSRALHKDTSPVVRTFVAQALGEDKVSNQ